MTKEFLRSHQDIKSDLKISLALVKVIKKFDFKKVLKIHLNS